MYIKLELIAIIFQDNYFAEHSWAATSMLYRKIFWKFEKSSLLGMN